MASLRATPSPMPRVPPVTTMLGKRTHQLAGGPDIQIGYKADGDRHLVRRQVTATGRDDFVFQRFGSVGALWLRPWKHVGRQEEACDRILPRPDQRHLDLGMAVDDGFDFFGMDLQTADIDDTAPAPNEIVAIASLLDDIAGIDEPVLIRQRI